MRGRVDHTAANSFLWEKIDGEWHFTTGDHPDLSQFGLTVAGAKAPSLACVVEWTNALLDARFSTRGL